MSECNWKSLESSTPDCTLGGRTQRDRRNAGPSFRTSIKRIDNPVASPSGLISTSAISSAFAMSSSALHRQPRDGLTHAPAVLANATKAIAAHIRAEPRHPDASQLATGMFNTIKVLSSDRIHASGWSPLPTFQLSLQHGDRSILDPTIRTPDLTIEVQILALFKAISQSNTNTEPSQTR